MDTKHCEDGIIWDEHTPRWKMFIDWLEYEVRPLLSCDDIIDLYENVENSVVLGAHLLKEMAVTLIDRYENLYVHYGLHDLAVDIEIYPVNWNDVLRLDQSSREKFLANIECNNMQEYFERYSPIMISCTHDPTLWDAILFTAAESMTLASVLYNVLLEHGLHDFIDDPAVQQSYTAVPSRPTHLTDKSCMVGLNKVTFSLFNIRVEQELGLSRAYKLQQYAYAVASVNNRVITAK